MGNSETTRGVRKTRTGLVVSDKGDKTVVIEIRRLMQHPVYKKYIQRRRKFHAHDENNQCRVGDRVVIEETRPLSKLKHWRVRKILERRK